VPFSATRHRLPAVLLRLAVAVAVGAALLSMASPTPAAASGGSVLGAGQTLESGQSLLSPQGLWLLAMQTDGNLVLYSCSQGGYNCSYPMWSLGTYGQPGNHLVMQTDGNLVLYSASGRAVWATMTLGGGSAGFLNVQDDSNLVIYNGGVPVWYTGTHWTYAHVAGRRVTDLQSLNGRYRFGTPGNGMGTWDLAVPGRVMWHIDCLRDPRVNCHVNGQLVLQDDGNLVWYQPGVNGGLVAEWNSGTWGMGPTNYLVLENDGNLVLYDLWHRPLWNSMGNPV
jgi:pseudomonalisin